MTQNNQEQAKPTFFEAPSELRKWLEKHHDNTQELWVGFYKKGSGKPSITWPESVDEALCFGWIDGIRKGIDGVSYKIRFTPRRPRSIWSAVNSKRVQELTDTGLMHPAGLQAFENKKEDKSSVYAYEQKDGAELNDTYKEQFIANSIAWNFFQAQAPWYQRTATWWVISAKREETRLKRLATLIESSEQGIAIPSLSWKPKSNASTNKSKQER
jgi:uncharacterized protein YdeI (YjbR/CyaY-like superfamily)